MAKGKISKRLLKVNKARQIFQKTNISYPPIRTHRRIRGVGSGGEGGGGIEMLFCREIWHALFLVATVLKFVLLPYY